MHFPVIKKEQMVDCIANDDYHIARIDLHLPVEENKQRVKMALEKFRPKSKDRYPDYKGLGLQFENEADPYYDVVDAISYITEEGGKPKHQRLLGGTYIKKNEAGLLFTNIFESFEDIVYLIRGRILISEPGNRISEHTDGSSTAGLHYVIQTDPKAKIIIEKKEYHLPADGYFYLVNASKPHSIYNGSDQDRIHIVFPINPACFKVLKVEQIKKMQKYFDQFQIDIQKYKHIKIID